MVSLRSTPYTVGTVLQTTVVYLDKSQLRTATVIVTGSIINQLRKNFPCPRRDYRVQRTHNSPIRNRSRKTHARIARGSTTVLSHVSTTANQRLDSYRSISCLCYATVVAFRCANHKIAHQGRRVCGVYDRSCWDLGTPTLSIEGCPCISFNGTLRMNRIVPLISNLGMPRLPY